MSYPKRVFDVPRFEKIWLDNIRITNDRQRLAKQPMAFMRYQPEEVWGGIFVIAVQHEIDHLNGIVLPYKEGAEEIPYEQEGVRRESPKVGRNDPCPCGSGKKYKKCCIGKSNVEPVESSSASRTTQMY